MAKKIEKTKNEKISKALMGNTNAETWGIDKSFDFLNNSLAVCKDKEDYVVYGKNVKGFKYHFLGEIASELDQYTDLYKYLVDKFTGLKPLYYKLKSNLEANCFSDSKKGIIKEASAIMNLKSNYGWTDRVDSTTKDKEIKTTTIINLGTGIKPKE